VAGGRLPSREPRLAVRESLLDSSWNREFSVLQPPLKFSNNELWRQNS
jgi:hypothetical protein